MQDRSYQAPYRPMIAGKHGDDHHDLCADRRSSAFSGISPPSSGLFGCHRPLASCLQLDTNSRKRHKRGDMIKFSNHPTQATDGLSWHLIPQWSKSSLCAGQVHYSCNHRVGYPAVRFWTLDGTGTQLALTRATESLMDIDQRHCPTGYFKTILGDEIPKKEQNHERRKSRFVNGLVQSSASRSSATVSSTASLACYDLCPHTRSLHK